VKRTAEGRSFGHRVRTLTSTQVIIDAADTARFVSRRKAREIVLALAGAFEADSTVCLHIANDVLYSPLVLAILASNCRWTGTNIAYIAPELEHHFRVSETKYIITAPEHLEVVRTAVKGTGGNAEIILFTDLLESESQQLSVLTNTAHVRTDACKCYSEAALAHEGRRASLNQPQEDVPALRTLHELARKPTETDLVNLTKHLSLDSTAALLQTSGTTGLPKMAARTHRSMIIEQQTIEDNDVDKPYDVRRLYSVPIFHGFAAPEMIFNALRLGHTSYFMRRFDDTFAQKIHDLRITETFGAPPMLLKLVSQPGAKELLQGLKLISFGGAPLAPELRKQTLEMFEEGEKPRIVPVYGMTEGGWFTTLKYPEIDDSGSVGRPVPGYEVKMVPYPDTELHDGQTVGEIFVRGPQLMSGYYNNPTATAEAFESDWLKTGDIGYVKEGRLYLVDRAKDLMKVNGWQVAPAELENALLQHSDVLDAAVLGIGQGVEEHPMACVVVRSPEVNMETIKLHLRSRLTGYKVSRCEVRFVDAIPKNPAGKILRKVLREQILAPISIV